MKKHILNKESSMAWQVHIMVKCQKPYLQTILANGKIQKNFGGMWSNFSLPLPNKRWPTCNHSCTPFKSWKLWWYVILMLYKFGENWEEEKDREKIEHNQS